MQITPLDNSLSKYENCMEELLEYKLEEVKSDWINDFGKISREVLNEVNDMITNPNEKRLNVLEKTIRKLRRILISKNLESMKRKINKYKTSTIDFSDIMIDIKSLEKELDKPLDINDLNTLYKNKLQPLKYRLLSRVKIVRNMKIYGSLTIMSAIIIAAFFYCLEHYG